MAIINGRRIQVPPSGITGQHLIQQVNPGPGRRPVIQQGLAFRPIQSGYRSEEHTSELQSHLNLVCRLLLEKKENRAVRLARDIVVWLIITVNDEPQEVIMPLYDMCAMIDGWCLETIYRVRQLSACSDRECM